MRDANRIVAFLFIAAGFLFCSNVTGFASSDREAYAAAVSYCRTKPNQLLLSEDRSIFCFDGKVSPERNVSSLDALGTEGFFVVRSQGGSGVAAARIATLLEQKRATVVVYDYCFSACASFFVAAGFRTYVVRDSIVAWHHGWGGWLRCDPMDAARLIGEQRSTDKFFCSELDERQQRLLEELRSLAEPFFKRRVIDIKKFSLENPPQSTHLARIVQSRFDSTGYVPDVLWMWNPRYHKATLRTEVIYEAYPGSQEEVDVVTRRLFGKSVNSFVLHDP